SRAWMPAQNRPRLRVEAFHFAQRTRVSALLARPKTQQMFIDEAKIKVKAGDGGNGCLAFRREKFVPRGGPSGGDGGKGGDVVMESSERHNTLVHFRFNPEHKAERGRHGEGANKTGRDGGDIVLKVPVGTIVYDDETGEKAFEFTGADQRFVVARGGRGGRGNAQFATSTHQAPREHEAGRPGEEHTYRLELKLLADMGLVGYPNVGKSTLISRISSARPKIADYPFTTLEPNLGVVAVGDARDEISFVVADIPGLIEGAHTGAGLGTQFLRHIERTRLLVHLVDVSDSSGREDVVKDVDVIMGELASFGAHLEDKPMIMVASKIDVANKDKLAKLKRYCKKHKLKLYEISAVTGKGIEQLKYAIAEEIQQLREQSSSNVEKEAS
ncbi:MAG TPA: GTPase ObgE, partial [Candidatus Sulfotelmatobacter sp.]|nr:GTPase ObgE [Candidatus Sulfotelmatobacter sp.]